MKDQNGDHRLGKENLQSVAEEWRPGGFAMDENAPSRQAFNIVLSMPAGTNEATVLCAARYLARRDLSHRQ